MPITIPEKYRDLLDGPVVVTLVTLNPGGHPQATPVWLNTDGDTLLVNSARGRQKDKNIARDPRVTILAIDPTNPYRWIEVRGEVVDVTETGAVAHINALAKLYVGRDDYYAPMPERRQQETRVTYRIQPTKINANG